MKQCKLKKFIKQTLCYRNKKTSVFSFNELVECLRSRYESTIVEYKQDICKAERRKLSDIKGKIGKYLRLGDQESSRKRCYGVYIIYCVCKPEENDDCKKMIEEGHGEVLYIGRSGTIGYNAHYEDQDLIERIFHASRSISGSSMKRAEQIFGRNPLNAGKTDNPCNEGETTNNQWFKCLCKVCELMCSKKASSQNCEPKLCIEIICIDVVDDNNRKPQCKLLTPAFIESLLLSCYLCEKDELPLFNSEL